MLYALLKLAELLFFPDFSSIGSFNQLTFHPLSGKVVVVDESTLVICNFVYDGLGPDAFFVVGDKTAASRPSPKDNKPGAKATWG
jgi:hypothetical protein